MAGGGAPTPTKGGKRGVDFTVNLVPTLDLLSVLIAFLLITAVWTQLARINTDQVLQKTADKPKKQQPQEERKDLLILVRPTEVLMKLTGEEPISVAATSEGTAYLKEVTTHLKEFKKRIGDSDKAIVAAEDAVPYHRLIQIMDVCLDVGLSGLAVGDPSSFEG